MVLVFGEEGFGMYFGLYGFVVEEVGFFVVLVYLVWFDGDG